MNRSMGLATHRAVPSGFRNAMSFGISSPKTMEMKVRKMKVMPKARVCVTTPCHVAGRKLRAGSTSRAMAGSPTHPKAIPAAVIPTWMAAMVRSMCLTASSTVFAPLRPCCNISSTRVFRTRTKANSAATKKAFTAMRRGILSSLRVVQPHDEPDASNGVTLMTTTPFFISARGHVTCGGTYSADTSVSRSQPFDSLEPQNTHKSSRQAERQVTGMESREMKQVAQ